MKRQWDLLMREAARLAVSFDSSDPKIRPEFVLAAVFYVNKGICQKIAECLGTEEDTFQASYLECLAHHYSISLSDALNAHERIKNPVIGMSTNMRKIVRNAEKRWAEKHKTNPPVDCLLQAILAFPEGLPILELCLDETFCDRESVHTYLVGYSRHFGNTLGSFDVPPKTYTSFAGLSPKTKSSSSRKKTKPDAKARKTRDINEIEQRLYAGVIGQGHAVESVMRALKKNAAGLKEEHKPVGVFVFAGPTGVGKTELARVLADATKMKLRRFDMSEYSQKHEVARLVGSPPGYVGYDEGGQLTNFVSINPKSIILFDEVDKAHPDVLDSLLQIAEEGELTDGRGKIVKFAETVVIITTNAGSKAASKRQMGFASGTSSRSHREAAYKKAIEDMMRDEMRGRMTDILIFNDLSPEQILTITGLELEKLGVRIRKNRDIVLMMAEGVAEAVAGQSETEVFGARRIKNTIDKVIAEPLTDLLLEHPLAPGTTVRVLWVADGGISLKVISPRGKKALGAMAEVV